MTELEQFEDGSFKVRIQLGVTQNLGDFNSSRIDIGVEREFAAGTSEDEATDAVYDFVETHLIEKANEVYEGLTGKAREHARVRPNA